MTDIQPENPDAFVAWSVSRALRRADEELVTAQGATDDDSLAKSVGRARAELRDALRRSVVVLEHATGMGDHS